MKINNIKLRQHILITEFSENKLFQYNYIILHILIIYTCWFFFLHRWALRVIHKYNVEHCRGRCSRDQASTPYVNLNKFCKIEKSMYICQYLYILALPYILRPFRSVSFLFSILFGHAFMSTLQWKKLIIFGDRYISNTKQIELASIRDIQILYALNERGKWYACNYLYPIKSAQWGELISN